ncbi:hypothetical protein T459_23696 [Capsicum annuum]|uniref:Uncharacterized protein n=2 Tax=Capsicum annuum TaxID=4072 RepID=A0A2G2YTF2_CAPAN|nr:hypothetical protein T459_23696 [Capsicum annuum]
MKTKKKVSQTRSLSNRSVDNVNFRKLEQAATEERGLVIQNNQKSSSGVQFQSQDQCTAVTAMAHRNQSRVREPEKEEEDSSIKSYSSFSENSNGEYIERENEGIVAGDDGTLEVVEKDNDEKFKSMIEKLIEEALLLENIDGEVVQEAKSEAVISEPEKKEIKNEYMTDVEHPTESIKQQNESILPDCLLLMMYEPKLAMEVSKEKWVCSSNTEKKKEIFLSEESNKSQHLPPQPPRSSCPFPDTMSMATMIEQKLGTSVAYEPFVLTRCKSEPMRMAATATTAAKLVPESCFWKNRKIEPHRRATFGFRAAGVGF